eukprot:c23797_g1_i1 orf=578-2497(+)
MAKVCTIVWFRRDLRLEDNPALAVAARAGPIIPVFIWCPHEEGAFLPGRVSRWWLKQSLIHLDISLRGLGAALVVRKAKDTLSVLLELVESTGATDVVYNHLYDPLSLVRDHRIKQGLVRRHIRVQSFNGDLLYEPWEVHDEEGKPFTIFESYWQKCLAMPFEPKSPLLPPGHLIAFAGNVLGCKPGELGLENETEKDSNALLSRSWCPGWSNADRMLESFVAGPLLEYAVNRHKIDGPTTSLLSPHLHFGEVSIRKVFHSVRRKQVLWAQEFSTLGEESANLFLRSIGFREYARYLCFNFPFTHERSLLSNLKSFPWRIDESMFKMWRQGRTGYPLVDAGMRELWATGWLHNRVRVIVASFCVKFLQLPWRWGMKYFWDALLDADLENDILGWQYISGSLPDGHELDLMYNPQTEGYKHDPHGEYVRQWLPELARLPAEWIHHPWDAPPAVLRAAGVELGCNYPRPIVEIAAAREHLIQAISQMWERDMVPKAASVDGQIEGSGESMEIQATSAPLPEITAWKAISKNGKLSSGSLHCDQMVPDCVREDKLAEINCSLKGVQWEHSAITPHREEIPCALALKGGRSLDENDGQIFNDLPKPPPNSDASSTAESSPTRPEFSEVKSGRVQVQEDLSVSN